MIFRLKMSRPKSSVGGVVSGMGNPLGAWAMWAFTETWGAERFALVIGNSDYQYVDNLPNTANNASDIAEKLSSIGYDVALFFTFYS